MNEDFGGWVDSELRRRGWSIRELGRRVGFSQTTIWWVVRGVQSASPQVCLRIAQAFELPGDEVLARAGYVPRRAEADGLGPEARYLFDKVARRMTLLEPREQEHITGMFLELVDFVLALKGLEEAEE